MRRNYTLKTYALNHKNKFVTKSQRVIHTEREVDRPYFVISTDVKENMKRVPLLLRLIGG